MNLRDELIQLTCDLIRFQSTAEHPDQLAAVIAYVADYLGTIAHIHLSRSESGEKPCLVATLHDTRSPALMLNGHLDVIAAQPEQFEPQVRGNRIYGRASQDMKGSVAVLLRLLKDLAVVKPLPDIGIQFVTDEEIGGEHGTGRLLEEGWRCGLFLAAEPTDLRICYEQKGILWTQVCIHGLSAHASRPWEGNNPLTAMAEGLVRLTEQFPICQDTAWYTTVTPTVIACNATAPNQMSSEVLLTLDIRYTATDTPAQVMETVQTCFPTATLRFLKGSDPLVTRPDDGGVQRLSAAAQRVLGQPAILYREHFGSDARFYSSKGIPAICFGPVGAGMHSDEEWVDIDSLETCYHILHDYILRLKE